MARFEAILMDNKIYDELVSYVRTSFPNACILYIDRVINHALKARFDTYCSKKDIGTLDIKRLFHGTSESAVPSICSKGYQNALNKRSAYGHGTYFASAGSYSKEYSDINIQSGESFMIINQVAVDVSTGGDKKNIFVIKSDDAALPEYVICFDRNAL